VQPLTLPCQQPPHQRATEATLVKPLSGICICMWHTLVVLSALITSALPTVHCNDAGLAHNVILSLSRMSPSSSCNTADWLQVALTLYIHSDNKRQHHCLLVDGQPSTILDFPIDAERRSLFFPFLFFSFLFFSFLFFSFLFFSFLFFSFLFFSFLFFSFLFFSLLVVNFDSDCLLNHQDCLDKTLDLILCTAVSWHTPKSFLYFVVALQQSEILRDLFRDPTVHRYACILHIQAPCSEACLRSGFQDVV